MLQACFEQPGHELDRARIVLGGGPFDLATREREAYAQRNPGVLREGARVRHDIPPASRGDAAPNAGTVHVEDNWLEASIVAKVAVDSARMNGRRNVRKIEDQVVAPRIHWRVTAARIRAAPAAWQRRLRSQRVRWRRPRRWLRIRHRVVGLLGAPTLEISKQLERLLPHQISHRQAHYEWNLLGACRHRQVA